MRVTWITHMAMRDVCEHYGLSFPLSGGWLETYKNELLKETNINLSIICVERSNIEEIRSFEYNGIFYQYITCKPDNYYGHFTPQFITLFNEAVKKTVPEIIHIHGTEFAISLALENDIDKSTPTCVSIQGLISQISERYYFGGTDLKKLVYKLPMFYQKQKAMRRGKNEEKILRRFKYYFGRTEWDYSHLMSINPTAQYFRVQEIIRYEFKLEPHWDIDKIKEHTIFCAGGASVPIKGFHNVLRAISIVKRKYPDVQLLLPGVFDVSPLRNIFGYHGYIRELITREGLIDNVVFLGKLSANEMADNFRSANCYIMASCIENSSNTLMEAMTVGTPIISSLAGGVQDFVDHKKEALIYRYEEIEMLAYYIDLIFRDKLLAKSLSENARYRISKYSDNSISLKDAYVSVIEGFYK